MYILVLESSTTSAKAVLYDVRQKAFTVRSKPYTHKEKEVGLHDADDVFSTTANLGRELCQGKKIDAVALSGTWHSVMLCDKNMTPATPIFHWTYTGASEICQKLRRDEDYVKCFYKKTGCMVNAVYPFFKLKLLRRKGWKIEDYKILGQGTYNTYKLTGKWVVTDVVASGSGLLNTYSRDYDDELLSEVGIGRENLGEIVRYNHAIPLSQEGASLLGLTPGIPVMPTMPDGSLNQVGSAALVDGVMTFSVGTSGAVRLATPKPIIPDPPSTWCYLTPTAWLSGAATSGCCNCTDWYKERFFPNIDYKEIEKGFVHRDDPAVFMPFLFGERCPGWRDDRRGGFFDLNPSHTSHDLYHAVYEGVLFTLYQCYELLTALGGVPHKIKLSGGILNSPYWTQMACDIFGLPMELDPAEHSSLMGAAAIGMEKIGALSSITQLEFPSGKIVPPNPEKANIYRRHYQRYLYWYERSV